MVALSGTLLGMLFSPGARAQSRCYDFGSRPIAARWESSGVPLGCPHAPSWPTWHLFTPPHRQPTRHIGFNPGNAYQIPRVIVTWRCTGLRFAPVTVDRIRLLGYVIDQAEYACDPSAR